MKKTINHGIPKHKVFAIAQPNIGESYEKRVREKPECFLEHKGVKIRCQLIDLWRFDLKEFELAKSLCMLAYGHPPSVVVKQLKEKYPELRQSFKVELLLFKEL